ncbi:MAG: PEGA domain-containing protein [Acidobacteria bacterium]|nr:PEGA domain-containing protein [Acidobacteriota bacterium]
MVTPRAAAISLPVRQESRAPRTWMTILLCAIALTEAPFVAMWLFQDRADVNVAAASNVGTVYVESDPSGLEVMVNGRVAGHTPARLSLPRGTVELQLRHAGSVRVLPLVVNPDETMRLRVEFPATTEPIQSSTHVVVTPSVMTSVPAALTGSLARTSHLPLP